MGFPSVAVNLCMHPTEAHPHPSPSGPVQRAGRSIDPRGSAAQADRSHPLEREGAKQGKGGPLEGKGGRSEENTFEQQSLMRMSYAVFRLKKKRDTTHSCPITSTHTISSPDYKIPDNN